MAHRGEQAVDEVGAGEIEQQDQYQFGNGPDDRRIDFEQVADDRPAIQLAVRASGSDGDADAVGTGRDLERPGQPAQQIAAPSRRSRRQQLEDAGLQQRS
jgi:hypothetical protein